MPNVIELMEKFSRLDDIDLAVHPERCVVVRNRNASCRRCAEVCPSGAIRLDSNELTIDPETCVGCGTCASACPVAALEARNPTDSELLQTSVRMWRAHAQVPVIACRPLLESHGGGHDRGLVVEIGCLGRLEESELVALVALGLEPLLLAHSDCSACKFAAGRAVADCVQKTMTTLLDAWGHGNPIKLVEGLPDTVAKDREVASSTAGVLESGMSRREFFARIKTDAQTAAVEAAAQKLDFEQPAKEIMRVTKVMKDGTLPHFIPNRRERLLDYLDHLGEAEAEYIDTRLWGHLRIDEQLCNSCQMCATFCPTGAIVKFDDQEMGVEHYCADCVQCRLCEDICPTKAATIDSRVSTRALTEGLIERYPMQAPEFRSGDPHQIYQRLYKLLGGGQIYEY